jgi:hypothetical protein
LSRILKFRVQLPLANVSIPVAQQMNPVELLQQQLLLQRQLESLQQEGRNLQLEGHNQMVTLQKSLSGADVVQQQTPSTLQQQLETLQKKEQQSLPNGNLPRQDLQRSTSDGGAQAALGSVRSEPPAVSSGGQQQQPTLPIKLFGVGIFFATDANGGQVVRSFVPGGPAERSGQVAIGDVIVSVDNTDVYGLPLATLAKYLLGPRGSTINMGFCKPHDKTVRTTRQVQFGCSFDDCTQGRINRVLITRGSSEEDRKGQLQQQQQQQSQGAQVKTFVVFTCRTR